MNLTQWNGFGVWSDNIPLPLPGVYGIQNLKNKKWYVGVGQDVAHRLLDYINPVRNACSMGPKIRYTLQKNPLSSFVIIPFYYQFKYAREELLRVEADLIKAYDSVRNGYNLLESSVKGPGYGKEFQQLCSFVHNQPRIRRAHSEAANKAYASPGYKKKHRQSIINGLKKPEARANQLAFIKILGASAEVNAKRSKSISKFLLENPQKFITNGKSNKKISYDSIVPVGWRYGLTHKIKPTGRPKKEVSIII